MMQQTFLSLTAEHILNQCGKDLSAACIVFPTRRAALFFRKELAKHIGKPVFAPEILSINDFIDSLSPIKSTDTTELLFRLYKSYKRLFPSETFNHYFHWGEMLLRDFNEMDLECTDAAKLFAAMDDLNKLELQFAWAEEEVAAIKKFWKEFSLKDAGVLKQSFLESWKAIPEIYNHFHASAQTDRYATEAMVWRNAFRELQQNTQSFRWNKIYFCGFYFLSRIHQKLMAALKEKVRVELLFDADVYYADDLHQEAGHAFHKLKTPFIFKADNFSSHPKTITITGVPMGEMQVKTAGQIILEWIKDGTDKSTAVILPDEKLLLPLLNSLPEEAQSFNVTMGFPVRHTVTGSFIHALQELHSYSRSSGGFYSLLVVPVLTHPGLPDMFKKNAERLHNEILNSQLLWIKEKHCSQFKLDSLFLKNSSTAASLLDYLLNLLQIMTQADNTFESSVAAFLHEKLSEIKPQMEELREEMDEMAAWKVVSKIIRSLRIPFSGEPVAGIQMMGILETRALDFERIIILSVNEGILPADASHPSFIPYSLRRAFGMPVAEQHDAVYAYHFYRLLQRAGEVHLIYDTEGKQFSGGEMSRFANQLMYEAERKSNGKCRIIHRVITAPLTVNIEEKIVIHKSEKMMEAFRKRIAESENGLSASALSAFISCRLRFYFRYVSGLREPDELKEVPGPEALGNLLHYSLEVLYGDKGHVSATEINFMMQQIEQAVNVAFLKVFQFEETEVTGYHLLNKQIVKKLVASVLEADASRVPFKMEGLEKRLKSSVASGLEAGGVIDRIQERNGCLEILDYKSGKAELINDVERIFSDPKYKAAFQLFFYAMLIRKHNNTLPIKAGLYVMKQLSEGIAFLNDGEVIPDEMINEFEKKLSLLIEEILNPSIPFDQTEDRKQCTYCPYAAICKRQQ